MYDMLQWFRNPNAKVSHLEGLNQANSKVIQHCHDTGNNLIYSKTDIGYPWDVKGYDSDYIFDWITELNWTSPSDYKCFTYRVAMCPRYWSGDTGWTIHHGTQQVEFHTNCVLTKTGIVVPQYTLTGPSTYDFGGDVGSQETIRVNYQWSPVDMEYLHLTETHGWVRWSHLTLKGGVWVEDQYSNHNTVVPGIVVPVFKCFLIP